MQQGDDLYMNQIDRNNANTFYLLQDSKLYLFTLFDLVQIIIGALTASSNFFSVPSIVKNPYNNVPLTKTDLINIYFQIKKCWLNIPPFIQFFFNTGFNVYEFKKRHENDILEYNVANYVRKASMPILYYECSRLLTAYDRCNICSSFTNWLADKDKSKLVDFMRPILKTHYLKKYTMNKYKQEYYQKEIDRKMPRFIFACMSLGNELYNTSIEDFNKLMAEPDIKWNNNHMYDDRSFNYYIAYGAERTPTMNFQQIRPRGFGIGSGGEGTGGYSSSSMNLFNTILGGRGRENGGGGGGGVDISGARVGGTYTGDMSGNETGRNVRTRHETDNTLEAIIDEVINNIFRTDDGDGSSNDVERRQSGQQNIRQNMRIYDLPDYSIGILTTSVYDDGGGGDDYGANDANGDNNIVGSGVLPAQTNPPTTPINNTFNNIFDTYDYSNLSYPLNLLSSSNLLPRIQTNMYSYLGNSGTSNVGSSWYYTSNEGGDGVRGDTREDGDNANNSNSSSETENSEREDGEIFSDDDIDDDSTEYDEVEEEDYDW